jgi:hypothetical protein
VDKKGVLHLRRLVGCWLARRRRGFRGKRGVRRLHEVRSRVQWQLPGFDASQALRGKRVSWNPVSSHDMDMGRRRCVKRRLHREAGAVSGCSSRTYTYDVWMPHWLRMYRHMLDIHQAERLIVPGLQALPSRLSPRSLSHDRIRPPTRLSRVQSPSSSLPVFALSHMGLVSLCICNRSPFIKQASRSVYGCCAPPTRSNSSVSFSTWRHAALSQRFRPSLIAASHTHLTVRAASWATKFNLRHSGSSSDSDAHEEAAKAAVLEAIKGRQQTDLMLRCESASPHLQAVRFIST